jgi:hypothetical protein
LKTTSTITAGRLNFNRMLAILALVLGGWAGLQAHHTAREIRGRDATVAIQHSMICEMNKQAVIIWDAAWEQGQIMRDSGIPSLMLPAPPLTPYECQNNISKRVQQRLQST